MFSLLCAADVLGYVIITLYNAEALYWSCIPHVGDLICTCVSTAVLTISVCSVRVTVCKCFYVCVNIVCVCIFV